MRAFSRRLYRVSAAAEKAKSKVAQSGPTRIQLLMNEDIASLSKQINKASGGVLDSAQLIKARRG